MVEKAQKVSPRMAAMQEVARILVEAGFVPDGETDQKTFRLPTVAQPLYGKSGGELVTTGGRARFALPGSNVKATLGKMKVFVYRSEGGRDGVKAIATRDTVDVAAVRDIVEEVVGDVSPSMAP